MSDTVDPVELRATLTYKILTSDGGEKPCTKERSITFSQDSSVVAYSIDGGRRFPSPCRSLANEDELKETGAYALEKHEQASSGSIASLSDFTLEWH